MNSRRGLWQAALAYASWGVFPLYWRMLRGVPALEVIGHRVVWSFALLASYLALRGEWASFRAAAAPRDVRRTYAAASILIAVNWLGFIWAVNAGYVVETSLGYYINPLLSVLLGVAVLGERLRTAQWAAVFVAAAGVLHIAVSHGRVPWIALLLATSFALYALVKKQAPLGAVHGLTLETGILVVPAALFLSWSDRGGDGAFVHAGVATSALLLGAGAVTTAPLLLFAAAARTIPLLWIGILQYIAPTLQLLVGVLVFGEPFARDRWIGFSLVWAALVLFAVDGVVAHRAQALVPPPE